MRRLMRGLVGTPRRQNDARNQHAFSHRCPPEGVFVGKRPDGASDSARRCSVSAPRAQPTYTPRENKSTAELAPHRDFGLVCWAVESHHVPSTSDRPFRHHRSSAGSEDSVMTETKSDRPFQGLVMPGVGACSSARRSGRRDARWRSHVVRRARTASMPRADRSRSYPADRLLSYPSSFLSRP